MKLRALNLYAGIGGNRKLWPDWVSVTAVEHNPKIAEVYQAFFPSDTVVVGDAHAYLLEYYAEFDFIWSSPPCPTHSQYRYRVGVLAKGYKPVYPDMTLWQEIIFLQYHARGKWVVENTVSYYKPLIQPQKVSRHYFWANFEIPPLQIPPTKIRSRNKISELERFHRFNLSPYRLPNKLQVLRNCVNSKLGLHVLNASGLTPRYTRPAGAGG
jgi:DNA (cytosine-5)-methyltransferase 1